uniref:Uncharacterized protein n=1 Tax=Anguilla anguilla TaxID=7936 RepID=A0A0E9TGA9_ANGAN
MALVDIAVFFLFFLHVRLLSAIVLLLHFIYSFFYLMT